jgi:hypothetical protein
MQAKMYSYVGIVFDRHVVLMGAEPVLVEPRARSKDVEKDEYSCMYLGGTCRVHGKIQETPLG